MSMERLSWIINRGFIILGELGKMFHMFSNSIDYEIIGQGGMSFEKSFLLRTNMS
jgi:hypothetical protein